MIPASYPVTVLMAVRNGGSYLQTAIESILNQSYRDFSFLIVDDASTDDTRALVQSYRDPRIKLVELETNVGQAAALNIGLRRVTTPWVARMDADDFSAPTRLEEQMQVVAAHPDLCCVGAFGWVFRDDPNVMDEILIRPLGDANIRHGMLLAPSMIHGSLVVKRRLLQDAGAYNERYRVAADFDMYERLLRQPGQVINIAKPLLGIRRHDHQDSRSAAAINEALEIHLRKLSDSRYSEADKQIIRSAVSFFYLLRVRYHLKSRQLKFAILTDLLRSVRASPGTVLRSIPEGIVNLRKLFATARTASQS